MIRSLFALWRLWGLVLPLFVLVACTPAVTGGPGPSATREGHVEPEAATDTPSPTETAQPTATVEAENESTEETVTENGKRVLTTDSRSERLRRVTASWGTNWNKHTIAYDELLSGGPPRDGIPSIDDPQFIASSEASDWLADNEPVIALDINGDARAYPLQILTWHEIVNDTVGGEPVIVTFCPLCNAALVFQRTLDGEVYEFGTSGLLRNSDLVMYDRTTESLWQQFTGEAIVGDLTGATLEFIPSSIVSFADFRETYPEGVILSRETGYNRRYGENPYVGYDTIGQNPFLFDGPVDERLPAMERVVAVTLDGKDVGYPYSVLREVRVVNDEIGDREIAVFFNSGTSSALGARRIAEAADVGAAGVFDRRHNGETLTFVADGDRIVDEETGSEWNILGVAVSGPLEGEALEPIVHGNHFWFSWAAFKPDTRIFTVD